MIVIFFFTLHCSFHVEWGWEGGADSLFAVCINQDLEDSSQRRLAGPRWKECFVSSAPAAELTEEDLLYSRKEP